MKVDVMLRARLDRSATFVRDAERRGYAGVWSAEAQHDPFPPLTLAIEHTKHVDIGTAVAVAFARTPLVLAHTAWDLQAFSGGRFILGLGSQVRAHIMNRFGMPWSHPADRMREMILAIRAIWDAWSTGRRLDYRGQFYRHTLMTPAFNPGPNRCGPPRIFLAAVGPRMTKVAAEVADGLLGHPFSTGPYFRDVIRPAVIGGLDAHGRHYGFEMAAAALLVTGGTDEETEAATRAVRRQIAFYGSTPTLRSVLDHHGWGDLHPELNRLSKQGQWDTMIELIDDSMLETFAIVAPPGQIAARVRQRFDDTADRITFHTPYAINEDLVADAVHELGATVAPSVAT